MLPGVHCGLDSKRVQRAVIRSGMRRTSSSQSSHTVASSRGCASNIVHLVPLCPRVCPHADVCTLPGLTRWIGARTHLSPPDP
jgi:hypothetical protein